MVGGKKHVQGALTVSPGEAFHSVMDYVSDRSNEPIIVSMLLAPFNVAIDESVVSHAVRRTAIHIKNHALSFWLSE